MNKQYHYAIKTLTANMFCTFTLATFSLFFSVSHAAEILEHEDKIALTFERLKTVIDGNELNKTPQIQDHNQNQWKLIVPTQLSSLLSAERLSELSETPLVFLHAHPILLTAANTGADSFFTFCSEAPNDENHGTIAYKVYVPSICLTKDANLKYAELYFTRKVPLASLHLYSSNIPYAEIETNYRDSLSRLAKEPEVHIPTLRANYEAGLAHQDAKIKRLTTTYKNSYWHGVTAGVFTAIAAYHFICLLTLLIL